MSALAVRSVTKAFGAPVALHKAKFNVAAPTDDDCVAASRGHFCTYSQPTSGYTEVWHCDCAN